MAREVGVPSTEGLFSLGRRLLGGQEEKKKEEQPARPERRASQRVALGLPVKACVGDGKFRECRIVDANLRGIAVRPAEDARPGSSVAVAFPGIPKTVPAFTLIGDIVRLVGQPPEQAMGIRVDRHRTTPDALSHYRGFVLYYLRHKPLLEEVNSGYFEARCHSCGWVGRVGRRNPVCSLCGGDVERANQ